jgi:hypothetical protein
MARIETLAAKIAFLGVVVLCVGIGLAIFGPVTREYHGPGPRESATEAFIQSYSVTQTSVFPVGYIMIAGLILLAAGFLVHVMRD